MRKRVSIFSAVAFLFILLSNSVSHAYGLWGYSWPISSMPVQYRISTSVPSWLRDDIERGFNTWYNVSGSYFDVYRVGDTVGNTIGNDGMNRICWITSGWSYSSTAIAVTVRSGWSGSNFTDVDLGFNAQNFDFENVDETACNADFHDVENIAVHEAGHFVGLDDLYGTEDEEKTMYGYASPCETKKRTLHSDDIDGIKALYSTILTNDNPVERSKRPTYFSYDQGTNFWAGIALRPPSGADYDLSLYSDPNYSNLLKGSNLATGDVDFVIVDYNHAPLTSYYPLVTHYLGTGHYQIEYDGGSDIIYPGSYTGLFLGADQVIEVWDAYLFSGETYTFRAKPTSGSADIALYLFQSTGPPYAYTLFDSVAQSDSSGSGGEEMFSFTPSADDWYGFVLIKKSNNSLNYNLYLDFSPPYGSVSINSGASTTNSTAVTLSLTATDDETGVAQMRFSNDGSSWSNWETYNTSKTWSLTSGDGTKTVYAQFKNNAGQPSGSFTGTILLDTVDPSGSISINSGEPYTNTTSVTLTLSASDSGSGVYQMQFSNTGTSWSAWEDFATSKNWTLSSGNGVRTVFVRYRDYALNQSSNFSDTITLDTIVPTGSISINGGATYANTNLVTLTLSASDAGSGVAAMRFSNDGSGWSLWEVYSTSKTWALSGGDGTKTVYVQYQDNAMNQSISYTDSITLDATAPSGSITINGGAAYTTSTSVTLTASASDSGSGVYTMRFSNDGTNWSVWHSYTTSPWGWSLSAGDGLKTVYVQFRDHALNVSENFSNTILLDTTAPTGSISINGGAPYTNTTSVTLTLYASDGGSGVSQMCVSSTASCTAWETFANSKPWTLSSGDGTKTVYVRYRDNALNTSGSFTNTIILETVAPTGSILINGGAPYTNSTSVTLTLSSTDAGSGVFQMRFSNDGSTWSTWEPYATSRTWDLAPGSGSKTAYVQFKDNAGNVSTSYTDTIVLDTDPPTGSIVIKGGAAYTTNPNVTLTLSATDTHSGVSLMTFSSDGTTWTAWEPYATTKSWVLPSGSGIKTIYVQYKDNAGNTSVSYSDMILLTMNIVDFDGDGKTDIAVWRPGNGYWYIIGSKDGIIETQWGTESLNDIPVPGDYDGDGKTDIAVWRPGDGSWYIIKSSDQGVEWYQWGSGALNDIPVPGDYDGDGKTDCAVWRPSNGHWYILGSRDGVIETPWGTTDDIPVPGDYDGDGQTDIAVWRPSSGYWYIIRSSDQGVIETRWGTGSLNDIPVPGDYDGDGKTDIAVWRPGDGAWHIIRSSDQQVESYQWGLGALNDVPVPGDYDGDKKTDCAVWRKDNGYWYIRRSSDGGVIEIPWGAGWLNDEPISQ